VYITQKNKGKKRAKTQFELSPPAHEKRVQKLQKSQKTILRFYGLCPSNLLLTYFYSLTIKKSLM
tara:strand:+ start:88 stop:282 length:195 start_codon:yes stop_codon:yes gene_type:complete